MFLNKFGDFDVLRMVADSAVLHNVKATFKETTKNLSACIIEIKCTLHKRAASGHYTMQKKKDSHHVFNYCYPSLYCIFKSKLSYEKNVSALLTLLIPCFSCLVQMQELFKLSFEHILIDSKTYIKRYIINFKKWYARQIDKSFAIGFYKCEPLLFISWKECWSTFVSCSKIFSCIFFMRWTNSALPLAYC